MILSIIIVNYNVKYFLEQCLYSVQKGSKGLSVEVIVVDNASTDGSIPYLQAKFPDVQFISNQNNVGFAKACNEGFNVSKGRFVLFLNPDTIVAEDSFQNCLSFFESHPECGALGVKMIDGSGTFLKESKRSLPSPQTSLFKLFGLSVLFPKSKIFSHYHLGHLTENETHEVDVLAGAFMMIRRQVLENVGGFDEIFFMYGEDIDLSYRIQKAGYKNYYFSGTTIVHFKGESTKRGSLNYVRMFYTAMSVFVQKHYGKTKAGVFSAFIHIAIWLRAAIAALSKFLTRVGLPVIDALLILLSFWLAKELWAGYIRTDIIYQNELLLYFFPSFTMVYLLAAYYAGLYDKYYRVNHLTRSTLVATLALLALYALLPEGWRFSRGIVVLGAAFAFVLITVARAFLIRSGVISVPDENISKPYILIAASKEKFGEIKNFLKQKNLADKIIGRIAINGKDNDFIAGLNSINNVAKTLGAKEIIFSPADLSYKSMIEQLENLKGLKAKFYSGNSLISSNDKTTRGEIISPETEFNLSQAGNRRMKRLVDVSFSVLSVIAFPIAFLVIKKPTQFFAHCFEVIIGNKTWIGYLFPTSSLPTLRKGILTPNGLPHCLQSSLSIESLRQLDYWYARDYEPLQDIKLLLKNYARLGG